MPQTAFPQFTSAGNADCFQGFRDFQEVCLGVCLFFRFGVFLMAQKPFFENIKEFVALKRYAAVGVSEKEAIWTNKTSSESVCILTKI